MHDIAELESRSLPGVLVATTEFVTAAQAQSTALGIEPRRVHIPHPIQDRTDDELVALADDWVDRIVAELTV